MRAMPTIGQKRRQRPGRPRPEQRALGRKRDLADIAALEGSE
jgi:hypothetical protein